jgi:FdhD protein
MSMLPNKEMSGQPVVAGIEVDKYLFAEAKHIYATMQVATEVPVSFVYGGLPYAVMMATPADLEDFAYGFSLTESIIGAVGDLRSVEIVPTNDNITIEITVSSDQFKAHLAKRRMMSGRTACGLCGVAKVEDLPAAQAIAGKVPNISTEAVSHALQSLEPLQIINQMTRSVHAAAWCDMKGHVVIVREDVGRHNALDKTIGFMARQQISPKDGFLLITSRASFEMIEKSALFGVHTIVAVSAPTSLAIQRADALGVRLFAIARQDSMIKFTSGLSREGETSNHE